MVNYPYRQNKGRPRTRPRTVERIRGEEMPINSICKYPKPPNISGNILEQLEEEYYDKSIEPYPNTLVVIVGHFAEKMRHTLNLYNANRPPEPHDLAIAYNGANTRVLSELIPECPDNCVAAPMLRPNWGWDLGMYSEAVTKYKYRQYFFINDDLIEANGNGWLGELLEQINAGAGLVGVQGTFFIRTSYYGTTRLFWLTFMTAILSGCLEFTAYRTRKFFPRVKQQGGMDAYLFEAAGRYFADRCGFGIGWLNSPRQFRDRNCIRYKGICASQWKDKPIPYMIDRIGTGLEEKISVDYVINWARQHPLRDIQ